MSTEKGETGGNKRHLRAPMQSLRGKQDRGVESLFLGFEVHTINQTDYPTPSGMRMGSTGGQSGAARRTVAQGGGRIREGSQGEMHEAPGRRGAEGGGGTRPGADQGRDPSGAAGPVVELGGGSSLQRPGGLLAGQKGPRGG